jgi:hypothetical protein
MENIYFKVVIITKVNGIKIKDMDMGYKNGKV